MEISELYRQIGYAELIAFVLGILLLALRPRDRQTVRNLLALLLTLVAALLLAVLLSPVEPRAATVLAATSAIGVGVVLIRFGSMLLFRSLLPALKLDTPRLVEDLFVTGLAVAWLLYWLHGAGLNLSSLLATSAVITAVLAFAMQDTLGNILGGVVLQLDNSLNIGDWVQCEGANGRVVDIRWRHTAIETRDGETVILPNGWLVKNRFKIIGSRQDGTVRWRRWVWFDIDLAADPGRVLSTLEEAVRDSGAANVLLDPPPTAVLMSTDQGRARYALRYWLEDPRPDDPTDSEVRRHALAALARRGIALAVPREERQLLPLERSPTLSPEELARRIRLLAGVDLFDSLAEDERRALAEAMVPASFVRGSTITRQGRTAHWLYLLVSGQAEVWLERDGERSRLATLEPGSVIGEMGMMTGSPRRATVTAKTQVECLRLDKQGFEQVLRARPDIAGEISAVIASRQTEIDAAERRHDGLERARQKDAIGARIRAFFALDD